MSKGAGIMTIVNPCKATQFERREALSRPLPPSVPLWLCGVSQAGAAGLSLTVQERKLRFGSHGTFLSESRARRPQRPVSVEVAVTHQCCLPKCNKSHWSEGNWQCLAHSLVVQMGKQAQRGEGTCPGTHSRPLWSQPERAWPQPHSALLQRS